MNTNTTAIIRCGNYSDAYDAIKKGIELIDNNFSVFANVKKVIIKPNLLKASPPENAVVTNPHIIGAVIDICRERGISPVIADSPAWGTANSVAEASDYLKHPSIQKRMIKDFERGRYIKSTSGPSNVYLAEDALDADLIINVPKLKTHTQMVMTGAVKNLFGCVIGKRKPLYHCMVKNSKLNFANMLLDILEALPPNLVIVDAVIGMEGDGPVHGTPRKVGAVIIGFNPIAVDTVLAKITGHNPDEIPVLCAAKERKKFIQFEDINLIGDDISNFIQQNFAKAPSQAISFSPHRVFMSIIKGMYLKYVKSSYCH